MTFGRSGASLSTFRVPLSQPKYVQGILHLGGGGIYPSGKKGLQAGGAQGIHLVK